MNKPDQNLLDRVHLFPLPAKDFDPLQADAAELARHGLPAKPDDARDPEMYEFWHLMLSQPLQFIAPEFVIEKLGKPREHHRHRRVGPRSAQRRGQLFTGRTHREGSRNWSGLYVTPKRPNAFTKVVGSWHVPTVSLPQSRAIGPAPINDEYRSSVWLGLDGHRRLPHASLPQIGTSQFLNVPTGHVTTAAWWQWWVNGLECPPVEIANLPVAAGDRMLASVTALAGGDAAFHGKDQVAEGWLGGLRRWGQRRVARASVRPGEQVLFHVKNQTSGLFAVFSVEAPTIPSKGTRAGMKAVVSGTTAEWIVERPTQLTSVNLYPLPRYTDVTFCHCMARSVPVLGGTHADRRLEGARLIKMYEVFERPHRTAFVSVPEKTGRTTARVFYREAP